MSDIIGELVRFTLETKYEDLPEPIVRITKSLLLDSNGCALAGITTDPGKMAIKIAKMLGGPPECSIIGTGDKVSITNAVFARKTFKQELPGMTARLTDPELVAKFRHNAPRNLTQDKIDKAVNTFAVLEKTDKVSHLISEITL